MHSDHASVISEALRRSWGTFDCINKMRPLLFTKIKEIKTNNVKMPGVRLDFKYRQVTFDIKFYKKNDIYF